MEPYLQTKDLAVGYDGSVLIHDINLSVERGKILTLIGPNGAGKSTILKSITRHLAKLGGAVYIGGREIYAWRPKEMARQVAVVLTDRIRPELMTCGEVVAMGRYPYTNAFGKLTERDKAAVRRALEQVHAAELKDRDFTALSDGQRQRILLARAICQEPEVIVLDEPTAFLDVRHKIELLDILRTMARENHTTVVMSLHEIDLAAKSSDCLLCVKGDTIAKSGPPDEIFSHGDIDRLYDMESGSYNMLLGSVELGRPRGEPKVFVMGGGGYGVRCYRALQKQQIPFAAGILFENDVDYQVARALSGHVVSTPAFEPVTEFCFLQAAALLRQCGTMLDAGTPVGTFNRCNAQLLRLAEEEGIPVHRVEHGKGAGLSDILEEIRNV